MMKPSLPPSLPEWKLCVSMCSIWRLCLYCKTVIFERPTSAGRNAREHESSHPTETVEVGGVGNLSQEWQDHPESSEARPMQSLCRGALRPDGNFPELKKGGSLTGQRGRPRGAISRGRLLQRVLCTLALVSG